MWRPAESVVYLFMVDPGAKSSRPWCQMLCSVLSGGAISTNNAELNLTALTPTIHLLFTGDMMGVPYTAVTSLLGPFVHRHFLFCVCLSFSDQSVEHGTPPPLLPQMVLLLRS